MQPATPSSSAKASTSAGMTGTGAVVVGELIPFLLPMCFSLYQIPSILSPPPDQLLRIGEPVAGVPIATSAVGLRVPLLILSQFRRIDDGREVGLSRRRRLP